jgi:DNA (cytosine-5)-methyltransferase 1
MKAIDLFAGAGGFTEGARLAGVPVRWAANHNRLAVEYHARNHPEVEHAVQDLHQADFRHLVGGCDLILASPSCRGHAECGQPGRKADRSGRVAMRHDADRNTAWAVVTAAEVIRPRALIVENTIPFTRWILFRPWLAALEALGYEARIHKLWAHDFGVPQRRHRVVVTAFLGAHPELAFERSPAPPVRTILEPCAGGWAPVASKPIGVRRRVARGRKRHGRTFLVQHVTSCSGVPLDGHMRTITTVGSHWHLVEGDRIRPLTVRELARGQGFGDHYKLPRALSPGTRLVGNAIPPPLAAAVIRAVARA